jgi:hypothetical protein
MQQLFKYVIPYFHARSRKMTKLSMMIVTTTPSGFEQAAPPKASQICYCYGILICPNARGKICHVMRENGLL